MAYRIRHIIRSGESVYEVLDTDTDEAVEGPFTTEARAQHALDDRKAEDAIDARDPFDDGDRAFDRGR